VLSDKRVLMPGLVYVEFVVEKMITVSGVLWLLWFKRQPSFSLCHTLVCDYRAEYGAPMSCPGGLLFKSPSEEQLSEIYLHFISPPGKRWDST